MLGDAYVGKTERLRSRITPIEEQGLHPMDGRGDLRDQAVECDRFESPTI